MQAATVKLEQVTFKTYLTGKQDPHPIFLEHRVYQGSSGAVYPYGVTDTLLDRSEDRVYQALILENDYLKVMILPELGGRVHRAYDKVNKRDFVYFNHVVKPALVGLLGPWISGGIEFNWPQHHRPTTYMPVDFSMQENADGSATVFVGEREPMHGLSVTTAFTLFKDKALLQIKSRVFNTTDTPKSFLWWSNPAVKGGKGHQSVFPPDVTAVFDHGKRAVIDFPIAHGEYYKVKYDGVDISRYQNLPVPTSYMAWRSDYDFVGAYCHDEEGGLLHVADHHVAPGKKQWTWGYGDFGQAWDRNLTDSDGPYIELMTGVYTDNQPDFTWLEPGEEKEYVQNFMPYAKLGTLQNANESAALKLERAGKELKVGVYATAPLTGRVTVTAEDGQEIYAHDIALEPCRAFMGSVKLSEVKGLLTIKLTSTQDQLILSYTEHQAAPVPLPETAPNPPLPQEVQSADEAYFIGQHLEQYHHATRHSADYYARGLALDPLDYRCNVALGNIALARADYAQALMYAENSLKRAHMLNRNPACGLGSLLKANALLKLGRRTEAYDEYFRATWSYNGRTKGYLGLAFIAGSQGRWDQAQYFALRALQTESVNQEALALAAFAGSRGADKAQALQALQQLQELHPLNPLLPLINQTLEVQGAVNCLAHAPAREINELSVCEFLLKLGLKAEALSYLRAHGGHGALSLLIQAALTEDETERAACMAKAPQAFAAHVRFINFTFERDLIGTLTASPFALHLCACFDYSRRLYQRAAALWQQAVELDPAFAEGWRGLAIYACNKEHDVKKARAYYAKAAAAAPGDERILFEQDLLLKQSGTAPAERLRILEEAGCMNCLRDDLKAEIVTLLNTVGRIDEAADMLAHRQFHVWEGGEGRVTGQYVVNQMLRAQATAQTGDYAGALELIKAGLTFPHNLGEGRLVVQTDNDLYFYAALYAAKAGLKEDAAQYLKLAQQGDTAIAEQRYYNDLPVDYVFYHALAARMDGRKDEAQRIFEAMTAWAEKAIHEKAQEDFFAVSLPDLVVLDRDLDAERRENCLLMRALGALGQGKEKLAAECFAQLQQAAPSNFKYALYQHLQPTLDAALKLETL